MPGKIWLLSVLAYGLLAQDEAAARAAQRLVRGGGDDVGERHRRRVHARGDEAGDVRHVHHHRRADLVGDLAELREVEGARVGAGADDDDLRLVLLRERRGPAR